MICERDNELQTYKLLHSLASDDGSTLSIQLQKWRAYLLKCTLDNISSDYLQGLLELMEFWVTVGIPKDCPHMFPGRNNTLLAQEYFTQSMYDILVEKNKRWLKTEIAYILSIENF